MGHIQSRVYMCCESAVVDLTNIAVSMRPSMHPARIAKAVKIISELPGSQGKRGNEYVTVSVGHVFYGECLFVVVSLNT